MGVSQSGLRSNHRPQPSHTHCWCLISCQVLRSRLTLVCPSLASMLTVQTPLKQGCGTRCTGSASPHPSPRATALCVTAAQTDWGPVKMCSFLPVLPHVVHPFLSRDGRIWVWSMASRFNCRKQPDRSEPVDLRAAAAIKTLRSHSSARVCFQCLQ